jgi:hypothetical protein
MCREPTRDEIDENVTFIKELQDEYNQSEEKSLEVFCLMVLNLNEFMYLD